MDVFEKAYAEAAAQLEREIPVVCGWGTCVHWYDPMKGEITGGFGSPLCGCDNLPGWKSRHPEGLPKPAAAVKARGRHGSRVQRSKARRREWVQFVKEFGGEV